jgi:hypothetical protein
MPAILIQRRERDKTPLVAVPHLTDAQAEQYLVQAARTWILTKPGRAATRDGSDLHLLFSDGKLNMLVTIDPVPPPPGDEPGQSKRKENA